MINENLVTAITCGYILIWRLIAKIHHNMFLAGCQGEFFPRIQVIFLKFSFLCYKDFDMSTYLAISKVSNWLKQVLIGMVGIYISYDWGSDCDD